jgi:hypothetical protein
VLVMGWPPRRAARPLRPIVSGRAFLSACVTGRSRTRRRAGLRPGPCRPLRRRASPATTPRQPPGAPAMRAFVESRRARTASGVTLTSHAGEGHIAWSPWPRSETKTAPFATDGPRARRRHDRRIRRLSSGGATPAWPLAAYERSPKAPCRQSPGSAAGAPEPFLCPQRSGRRGAVLLLSGGSCRGPDALGPLLGPRRGSALSDTQHR